MDTGKLVVEGGRRSHRVSAEKMQELNEASVLWTEAMGVESMLSGLSRIGSMLSGVFSSVGRVFTAAADKEDFAVQLGVMMNSSLDGSALADSLERLATIFSHDFQHLFRKKCVDKSGVCGRMSA